MTDTEKIIILRKALEKAAKFCRENPSGDFQVYAEDPVLMQILAAGTSRDPEGKEYVTYFIFKALEENKLT